MSGMNAQTGRRMDDLDHLNQSIAKVLTTPIASRPQRRNFGSDLFALVDQPDNPTNRLRIYASTADAIAKWEPRIALVKVTMQVSEDGLTEIDLEGEYRPNGLGTGEMIVIKGVRV